METDRFISSIVGISLFLSLTIFLHYTFTTPQEKTTQKNPIIYMIATPCSAMTQVLRMVHQRGDFTAMHIPANLAYCHEHNYLDLVKGWYKDDAPTTYQQALTEIKKAAEKKPLFIAETSHTATEFLTKNPEFVALPNVKFLVLIGNIHNLTISHYEKKKDHFDKLPPEQMSNAIGLKALYEFITELKKQNKKVVICSSPDLFYKPESTVEKLCKELEISFLPQTLHWPDISENFSTLPFWTIENNSCSLAWQNDAIESTGFTEPKQYTVDKQGNPTFEEIKNKKHRDICAAAYQENMQYYTLIMNNAANI